MLKISEIQTVSVAVTIADTAVGTAVPANFFRYILKWKAWNGLVGPNLITLGKSEEGGATETLDIANFSIPYEVWSDPEQILEISAPLFRISSLTAALASTPMVVGSAGAGYLTLWYIDAPSLD